MKILYGVQGTGNGHITRALAMEKAFRAYPELEITWLLSSRPRELGLGGIAHFQWRKGLGFEARNGKVDLLATLRKADLGQFWQDVRQLDLAGYDMVISDYEPVISHAARKRGIPVTGIGHQYAFVHQIPGRAKNRLFTNLMQLYAPATMPVGLHWHHFDSPILPPIVDLHHIPDPKQVISNQFLVYLPFENPEHISTLLRPFSNYEFYIYHPALSNANHGNLHYRAISRTEFKSTLASSVGVISNAGFELISECLQWHKAILAKPLSGQPEQLCNAAALEQLGYATVVNELTPKALEHWLTKGISKVSLYYPDVAAALAGWIADGQNTSVESLADTLWQQVTVEQYDSGSSLVAA